MCSWYDFNWTMTHSCVVSLSPLFVFMWLCMCVCAYNNVHTIVYLCLFSTIAKYIATLTGLHGVSGDLFQHRWWIHPSKTSRTPCRFSSPLSIAPSSPPPPVADVFTRNPLSLPLLLGKTNLGQSLLLNEFYFDKLLPFPLQRQLQSTQPSPQPGTPPHSRSDWLRSLRLQHLWSPIGPSCSVMLWLAGLQGVLFLWDGCRGAQEDLCAHREIPTNLSQAGRLPKHHVGSEAAKLKWSQSFLQLLNLSAFTATCHMDFYNNINISLILQCCYFTLSKCWDVKIVYIVHLQQQLLYQWLVKRNIPLPYL